MLQFKYTRGLWETCVQANRSRISNGNPLRIGIRYPNRISQIINTSLKIKISLYFYKLYYYLNVPKSHTCIKSISASIVHGRNCHCYQILFFKIDIILMNKRHIKKLYSQFYLDAAFLRVPWILWFITSCYFVTISPSMYPVLTIITCTLF